MHKQVVFAHARKGLGNIKRVYTSILLRLKFTKVNIDLYYKQVRNSEEVTYNFWFLLLKGHSAGRHERNQTRQTDRQTCSSKLSFSFPPRDGAGGRSTSPVQCS